MSSDIQITDSDWKSWRIYVLKELERLNCNQEALEKEIADLKVENNKLWNKINYLNWRSGVIGTIAGSLGTIAAVLMMMYMKIVGS